MTAAQASTYSAPSRSRRRWASAEGHPVRCWRRRIALAVVAASVIVGSTVGAGSAAAALTVTRNYDGTWMYSGFTSPQNCGQFAWAHFPRQTAADQMWCFQNADGTWHISVPYLVD